MCGLLGWDLNFSKIRYHQRVALATALMIKNDDRGGHGWGYWSPDWPATKKPVKGTREMHDAVRACTLARYPRIVGHTRLSTQGKVCHRNSHPFICGNVVGAHNGCLSNHTKLNKLYDRDCQVDSEHIFWHLAEHRELNDLEGYGAIVYVHLDDPSKIHIAQFNGGEIAVAKTKVGTIWSSSKLHLDSALNVAGIDYVPYKIEEGILYYAKDNQLYETEFVLGIGGYRPGMYWSQTEQRMVPIRSSCAYDWGDYCGSSSYTSSSTFLGQRKDDFDDKDGIWVQTATGTWVKQYPDASSNNSSDEEISDEEIERILLEERELDLAAADEFENEGGGLADYDIELVDEEDTDLEPAAAGQTPESRGLLALKKPGDDNELYYHPT